jgi:hypothetical protein
MEPRSKLCNVYETTLSNQNTRYSWCRCYLCDTTITDSSGVPQVVTLSPSNTFSGWSGIDGTMNLEIHGFVYCSSHGLIQTWSWENSQVECSVPRQVSGYKTRCQHVPVCSPVGSTIADVPHLPETWVQSYCSINHRRLGCIDLLWL